MKEQTRPKTKREYLARSISDALGDHARESLYLQYLKKYPLATVFRAFAEAKSYPAEKIKKSRAAVFFYLIKRYTHDKKQNTGS